MRYTCFSYYEKFILGRKDFSTSHKLIIVLIKIIVIIIIIIIIIIIVITTIMILIAIVIIIIIATVLNWILNSITEQFDVSKCKLHKMDYEQNISIISTCFE